MKAYILFASLLLCTTCFAQVGAGTETHPRGGPRSKTEIHTIDYVTPHNVHYLIAAETPQEAINRKFSGSEPYKTWSVTDVYYQSCPSTKAVLLNEKGKFQKFIVTNRYAHSIVVDVQYR